MIPFENPQRFQSALAAGTVRRIGATLRDVASGKIAGHVQETTGFHEGIGHFVGGSGNPVGLLLSAGQLASSLRANVQLEQVKAMMVGLGMLSAATLAAAVVGIGVSAAGFALVLKRLSSVERTLSDVHTDILANRIACKRIERQLVGSHHAAMESALTRADEAWERTDAEAVWRELDGVLDQVQRYWRGLVGGGISSILVDGRFTFEEAVAAYEAALTLAAARIQVLLLLEQKAAALHHACDFHSWHEAAVGQLIAIDIATARSRQLAQATGLSEEDARSILLRWARPFTERIHEAKLHIGTRPEVLRTMIDLGIGGREYVETVRQLTDSPLVILPTV